MNKVGYSPKVSHFGQFNQTAHTVRVETTEDAIKTQTLQTVKYKNITEVNDPDLNNKAHIDSKKKEIVVPSKSPLLKIPSIKIKEEDGKEEVYKIRKETAEEKKQFEKDWSSYQSALKMHEAAVKMGQAADLKIAKADENIKKADEDLKSIREQKRICIIGKLDSANTLLTSKFAVVSNLKNETAKKTFIEELRTLITNGTQLKAEAQSISSLDVNSLDAVSEKFTTFGRELNLLCNKIKQST